MFLKVFIWRKKALKLRVNENGMFLGILSPLDNFALPWKKVCGRPCLVLLQNKFKQMNKYFEYSKRLRNATFTDIVLAYWNDLASWNVHSFQLYFCGDYAGHSGRDVCLWDSVLVPILASRNLYIKKLSYFTMKTNVI